MNQTGTRFSVKLTFDTSTVLSWLTSLIRSSRYWLFAFRAITQKGLTDSEWLIRRTDVFIDQNRYGIAVLSPGSQTDCSRSQILQPKFGIRQPLG
jgi:hypothetical protein